MYENILYQRCLPESLGCRGRAVEVRVQQLWCDLLDGCHLPRWWETDFILRVRPKTMGISLKYKIEITFLRLQG